MNKAVLLITCCLALLQAASGNVASPRFNTESEEYAVYSAVLRGMHKLPANKSITVVDRSRSPACTDPLLEARLCDDDGVSDTSGKAEPCPSTTTQINYIRANIQQRHLDDHFDTERKHSMLANDVFEDIFKDGCCGWSAFFEKYPDSGGYVTFSRVGFNGSGTQALVYVVRMCGGLCGSGCYVFLEKKGGAWQTQRWLVLWLS
jgi:hypothetical protein